MNKRVSKALDWFILGGSLFIFLFVLLQPAFSAPKPSEEQKLLNAMLNKQYPSGKGPSSTTSAHGFYKGGGGNWKRR